MYFHLIFIAFILSLHLNGIKSEPFGPEGDYSLINEDVFGNEVKCLVCKASIEELKAKLKTVDPTKTEDVGGYKFDSDGNMKTKAIPRLKSEIFISETIDEICSSMDNYVRAKWKSTGELTLLRMFTADGKMNTDITSVDLVQDEDLNKSLEFYCKSVFEEYEENVIHHITTETDPDQVAFRVCTLESNLCPNDQNIAKEEL